MKYYCGIFFIFISGCTTADETKIASANIVLKDEMPQLKICFNRKLLSGENFISDVKVITKNDFTFGRSDMYVTGASNTEGNCIFEPPYFFLRNTRDEDLRKKFMDNMKPNNIRSIEIKLGSNPVDLSYSDKYKISEYKKVF
ncbi:hypothetical protein [Acinetobacter johnsonii]|uniref:hypothetical protein n=1 Tax=Acinetobacter johnsonii TaxID=40214 RepID=UPI00216A041B|nr:hypothetical protein [Acinetobacter johnsonii]MCS3527851.1 hypothetical protein [Acinetobacter johnsonii]